jgi:hypothetical protein
MYGSARDWEQLERLLRMLVEEGAIAGRLGGGHIHLGVGDVGQRFEVHEATVRLVGAFADPLFRLG